VPNVTDADLYLLRIFMTVVRCAGISAAQQTLNLSQSTISGHIIALEERLGCKLCVRGRSGFRVTENGVTVLRAAERLFAAVDDFGTETAQLRGTHTGEVRLGIIDNSVTDGNAPLEVALQRLFERREAVEVRLVIGEPRELQGQVLEHRLDLAICGSECLPGLAYERLYQERYGFFCGRAHPLFVRGNIDINEIRSHWLVERGYRKSGDVRYLGMARADSSADQIEAQLILVLTGRYLGFLPLHYARPWVEHGRLKEILRDELGYAADINLVTRADSRPTPAVKALLEEVRAAFRQTPDAGPPDSQPKQHEVRSAASVDPA
jgi:LysR family transcriptional regulator, transcriptional activator for bauABCD operon